MGECLSVAGGGTRAWGSESGGEESDDVQLRHVEFEEHAKRPGDSWV